MVAEGGRQRAEARDRIIVVGDGDEGAQVRTELGADPERPALVVGTFDTASVVGAGDGLPLVRAADATDCSVIVLSRLASEQEHIVDQAAIVHRRGVRIRTLVGFYAEWLGKLPIAELERASMLFDVGEIHGRRYGRLKRIVDVVGGAGGLVALVVAIPFVGLGNLVGNRGTLFYRQPRVGRDGRVFTMWKFRTMTGGAASDWTSDGDARVTRSARCCGAPTSTSCPRPSTSSAATSASSVPAPSSLTTWRSSPTRSRSTTCVTSCARD